MPTDSKLPEPQREQTDESLRVERDKADHALTDELTFVDDTADAVITRARARADALLAAAREKIDRKSASTAAGVHIPATIAWERVLEDRVLQEERASADETLRAERAEHVALLANDRKETDRDLLSERAQSDGAIAMRDEFLGIVSHDLRNLLNTIVLFARAIAEGVLKDEHVPQVLEHAQRIQRSGVRMNRLIGDLVDVASINAGALVVTTDLSDPSQVVAEAVHAFQAQALAKQVSLESDVAPTGSLVALDSARILQVLINLLSNAIKFTPAQGKVTVHMERIENELRFSVSDTGEGIAFDKLEAVFERFVQTTKNDRRGVGLGLYISRCIVQGHGGRLWVESEVGKGSTFFFTLPLPA